MDKKIFCIILSCAWLMGMSSNVAATDYCLIGHCGKCLCWIENIVTKEQSICDQNDTNDWCIDSGKCNDFCNFSSKCQDIESGTMWLSDQCVPNN